MKTNDVDILKPVARYLRDLLSVDEEYILFGRTDDSVDDYEEGQIVIDYLTYVVRNRHYKWDNENEVAYYSVNTDLALTLNFYGTAGVTLSQKFIALSRSERARQLQRTHGLTAYAPTGATNLKRLLGHTHIGRLELEMKATVTTTVQEELLAFETVEIVNPLINKE